MCSKLGTMKTVGMRLRRGYAPPAANAAEVDLRREEADDFAARVPVDKLVFVVHGIGQVSEPYLSRWCCAQHRLIAMPIISRLTGAVPSRG